jgi:hypothetical protein
MEVSVMKLAYLAAGVLVLGTVAAFAVAQEADEKPAAKDVKALVEKLGDPDYQVRESAEKAILALGEKAVPALEAAMKNHQDAHVRFEAERLLGRIRGEKPLVERRDLEDLDAQLEDLEKRMQDWLRGMEEHGSLWGEEFENLRKMLEGKTFPRLVRPLGEVDGEFRGTVQSNGKRIEYHRDAEGKVEVKITRDGKTEEYTADSFEALKKASPDVAAEIERSFGGGRFEIRVGPQGGLGFFRGFGPHVKIPTPTAPGERPLAERPGAPPQGFRLGVWTGEVPDVLRAHLKLAEDEGVVVEEVVPGSLAARMGLARFDVIRTVNGTKVGSAGGIVERLQDVPDGGQVTLEIVRGGAPMTLVGKR